MRFWKPVKQLGVLVALLLAGLQVWDWVNKPSQKLEADVQYGPFLLPPQVEAQFTRNQALVFEPWISPLVERTLLEDGVSEKSVPRLANRLSGDVRQHLRNSLTLNLPSSISGLRGLWRASVRNGGSQPLQAVRLVLPLSATVIVEREGANPTQRDVDSIIELETVHPREVVRITAWAKSEPIHPTEETVRLTHASGTGTVFIQQPVGAVGQFVDRYWPLILFVLAALLPLLIPIFSQLRWSSATPTRRTGESSGPAEPPPPHDG